MFLSWKKFGELQGYSKLDKIGVFSQGGKLSPFKTRLLAKSGLKLLVPRSVGKMISLTDAKRNPR